MAYKLDANRTIDADRVTCQICGAKVPAIEKHLRDSHPDTKIDDYMQAFPHAAIMTKRAHDVIIAHQPTAKTEMLSAEVGNVVSLPSAHTKQAFHEVFELGNTKSAKNGRGESIQITVHGTASHSEEVPAVDGNYVFNIDHLKTFVMGFELAMPMYYWGHAGTGKTTLFEQICARTNRRMIRVQHTANMAEDDVTGRWIVKGNDTVFDWGPLPIAMREGCTYIADEYDFAYPSVLSVYQAVLEGKPLFIKDAPDGQRIIKPHPDFRFVATGNTNGAGDEHGLYPGRPTQDAANFSRFGITEQAIYMSPSQEALIVQRQAGIHEDDAELIVKWANEIRKEFDAGQIGVTPGPRELIHAAVLGARKASFVAGVKLAITNRASKVDREIAEQVAQRILTS